MPLTSPGNDDDTGENHQPTLRKNTAEPVEQTLKQNTARLVRRRFAEVVAYFEHPYANAVLEGADSVVRNVKRRACGFRDMDYFATMVYLTCGKLDLKAVTTSPSVRVFCKLARTRTSSQLV